MPPRLARIQQIEEADLQVQELRALINDRLLQINRIFEELEITVATFQGTDGFTPQFSANIDMLENRLTNLARSRDLGDAVTRQELTELGILGTPGLVDFQVPVRFSAGFESLTGFGLGDIDDDGRLEDALFDIEQAGGLPVAVRDGEVIDTEDLADGTNGITTGNLSMAVDGKNRARVLRQLPAGLLTHDRDSREILDAILETLQRIEGKLNGNT